MFFEGADSKQLAMLMTALNDYCQVAGVNRESRERLEAAYVVRRAFKGGARTPEQLRAALGLAGRSKTAAPRRSRSLHPANLAAGSKRA
jgi:hypothetical protein